MVEVPEAYTHASLLFLIATSIKLLKNAKRTTTFQWKNSSDFRNSSLYKLNMSILVQNKHGTILKQLAFDVVWPERHN